MTVHIQIEQVGALVAVETISNELTTGHTTMVTVGEAAVLVEELLALPRVSAAYQAMRDRSGASHEARASRK